MILAMQQMNGILLYDLDQDGKEELLIGEMDMMRLLNRIIF